MRVHGHAEHDPADYVPREMLDERQNRDPMQLYENVLLEYGSSTRLRQSTYEPRPAASHRRA